MPRPPIGSTAIPGLSAKPIIDLLAEVCTLEAGCLLKGEYGIAGRRLVRREARSV